MPLSEQEQRLLDEMERGLYQSTQDRLRVDPSGFRLDVRRLVLGVVVVVLGITTLLVGVSTRLPVVGIIGFGVMFAGVVLAIALPKRTKHPNER